MMPNNDKGIFFGLERIANRYLLDPTWKRENGNVTNYGHTTNCLRLSGDATPEFFNAEDMIREMFCEINNNILDQHEARTPSSANWNINYRDKSNPEAGEGSEKPEVTLERAIIQARRSSEAKAEEKWTYQMPIATGLFDEYTDKSSNIDLVRMRLDGVFDLFELKVGSNNPLYAAVEILQYGLAYIASRRLANKIGYNSEALEMFSAKIINLCVLAPSSFYQSTKLEKYNFGWLEKELNIALNKMAEKYGYKMTFSFCFLDYIWEPTARPNKQTLDELNTALNYICHFNEAVS
jgi:hypothetical protein